MPMVSDWCQCIMKKYFIGCQWILKSLFVGICVFCTANGFYITFHWHSSVYFHDGVTGCRLGERGFDSFSFVQYFGLPLAIIPNLVHASILLEALGVQIDQ